MTIKEKLFLLLIIVCGIANLILSYYDKAYAMILLTLYTMGLISSLFIIYNCDMKWKNKKWQKRRKKE